MYGLKSEFLCLNCFSAADPKQIIFNHDANAPSKLNWMWVTLISPSRRVGAIRIDPATLTLLTSRSHQLFLDPGIRGRHISQLKRPRTRMSRRGKSYLVFRGDKNLLPRMPCRMNERRCVTVIFNAPWTCTQHETTTLGIKPGSVRLTSGWTCSM
jgi:hypothetical protein